MIAVRTTPTVVRPLDLRLLLRMSAGVLSVLGRKFVLLVIKWPGKMSVLVSKDPSEIGR